MDDHRIYQKIYNEIFTKIFDRLEPLYDISKEMEER